jgi:AcrR family transcriptional regulator
MGHREQLLEGAKRCLQEKGYTRTTARDIVAASGTNLASIGYHYGSKEKLMNAALGELMEQFGAHLGQSLAADMRPGASQLERFEWYWGKVLDSMPEYRNVWAATFEIYGQLENSPELRAFAVQGYQDGRALWALLLSDIDAAVDPELAQAVGTLHQALLSGVLAQCLVDPEHAPSAKDLALAMRTVAAGILSSPR